MAKILVVDDTPASRQMLTTLLGYYGHTVVEAADGEEALELARAQRPDLMIVDILMPTLDGFELVRRLRLDPLVAQTAVIFYSATYLEHEAHELAERCGVTHILLKPAEPEVIVETVSKALGEPVPAVTNWSSEQFHESRAALLSGKLSEVVPRLTALIDLGKELARAQTSLHLVQVFCHQARAVIGAKYAAVGLLDEDGTTLAHFVTSGISTEEAARIGAYPTGLGVLAHALHTDKAFRVADIRTDPQSVGFPANHPPMTSFLGAPIMIESKRYGAFYFADKIGKGEFTPLDEEVAATLAAQIGVAYESSLRRDALEHEIAERRHAETAQHASELRYRRLFEAARDGILILDVETGTIVDVNPFLVEMLGYSHDEFIGKAIWEIGAFSDFIASQSAFRELVENGYVRYEDLPLETKAGKRIAVEFISNVYKADDQNVI